VTGSRLAFQAVPLLGNDLRHLRIHRRGLQLPGCQRHGYDMTRPNKN
jgi:hypothetical protein